MKFITYNDSLGGVYQSQVIDVCRFLQSQLEEPVELIAFVSLRTFFKDRKKIKKEYKNSIVLPSFPGIGNWKKNCKTLNFIMLFKKHDKAIARGVFATHFAINCKKFSAVCYDARGAYAAEWKEYLTAESATITKEIAGLEKEAVTRANFRIAVSEKLVSYWRESYGYSGNEHVIIPCTISSSLKKRTSNPETRREMGISETDVLLVFSGSLAGWQSISNLYSILKHAFAENNSLKLLLLSKENSENELLKAFPGRVIRVWVEPEQVSRYLQCADYGLLYREESITNRVSSPVKFAEYLAAGLPVIISNHVGDYSSFVVEKNCGVLFSSVKWSELKRPSEEEKSRIQEIAFTCFTKPAYIEEYRQAAKMK